MSLNGTDVAGAGMASVAVVLQVISPGLPIVAWVAAFSGALFGIAFFPSDSQLSRPLVIFANMLAAVFLTGLVVAFVEQVSGLQLASKSALVGGVTFLVAVCPLPVIKWLRSKFGVKDA